MVFFNAVQGVLSIIIMLSLGYYLTHKGWFDDKASKLFSKIVINISLPAYMVSNLMGTYDKNKLIHLGAGLLIPFSVMAASYLLAMLTVKIIKLAPERAGTFCSMFALSNTIFVGLPVNLALFGDESLPYVLLYYIANTTTFWTFGVYGISRDGGKNDKGIFTKANVKRIFSPPLSAFLFTIVLILLEIKLPKTVMDTCKYLGNLTTPLSMLFIGIVMYSVKLRDIKVDRSMIALLIGRFILGPAAVFGLCYFFPLPVLMKKVFIVQAAMPAMTQTAIIAEAYNADYKYAAVMTTVTTVVSLVSIPFYMLLLNNM